MQSVINKLLVLSSLMILNLAQAATPDTIAAWVGKSDGDYAIYISALNAGEWTAAEIVASSDNRIIATAIGSYGVSSGASDNQTDDNLIVVWTEVVGEQWLLMFATQNDGAWTRAEQLTRLTGENLAPTIVHDLGGNPWVFWSSNASGNDDIYVTKAIDGTWSETEMVNQPNQFPDMVPSAQLADNGDVLVKWDTLNTKTNQFIKNEKRYPNSSGVTTTAKQSDEITNKSIPPSARTTARINLHYPANKFVQSRFVQ